MKKPKIKYSFMYINLKNWLKENHHRFPANPQIVRLNRNGFFIVFSKVKNIAIEFQSSGGINIWAWKGVKLTPENADILTHFDLYEKKDEQGDYYCFCCESPKHYQDRHIFWEQELYEPLLAWSIKNISQDNSLCIYESKDKGYLWAKINFPS